MIRFPIEFLEPAVEAFAYVAEYPFEPVQMPVLEHLVLVFRDENQMHMHVEDTVSSFT